jgi:hypothetical protein
MNSAIAWLVSGVFVLLALWHVRMAFGPMTGESGAVPSVNGKPVFVPTQRSTLLVAVALLICAALVAAAGGAMQVGIPAAALSWLCYLLALGLLVRAVGDFKYVGFFKRVRGSPFARMDTVVYSPLCLLLSAGVAVVASGHSV